MAAAASSSPPWLLAQIAARLAFDGDEGDLAVGDPELDAVPDLEAEQVANGDGHHDATGLADPGVKDRLWHPAIV